MFDKKKKKRERQQETKFSIQEKKKKINYAFQTQVICMSPSKEFSLKENTRKTPLEPSAEKITHSRAGSEVFNRFPSF